GQAPPAVASVRLANSHIRLAEPPGAGQPLWNRRRAQAPPGLARVQPSAGGEERRRAVCGRTARTVRSGGGRNLALSRRCRTSAGASRRPSKKSLSAERPRVEFRAAVPSNDEVLWSGALRSVSPGSDGERVCVVGEDRPLGPDLLADLPLQA